MESVARGRRRPDVEEPLAAGGDAPSDVDERLDQAEALLAVATTVSSTLDTVEALRRICRELVRLLGADAGAAYRHDGDAGLLRPCAAYRVPKDLLPILGSTPLPLCEQGFYGPLWRDRRPVWSDDVAADPRFTHDLFRRVRHQSALVLPLELDGQVAGAFYVAWWTARRRFTSRELALVADVAARATQLLRNTERFAGAQRDRQRLQMLNEVSRRLAAAHDPGQILGLILDEATRALGVEAAGIRLLEGNELVVAARTESAAALMATPRLRVGSSLSGRVVEHGEPVLVEDLAADERYAAAHKRAALQLGFHAFAGVPLRIGPAIIGALVLFSTARRQFGADEVALLAALADQAALAIDRGRLLTEAEEGRRLLARLYRVGLAMQASWRREERLDAFIRGARDVMGFDRLAVLLLAPGGGLEPAAAHGFDPPLPPELPVLGPLAAVLAEGRPVSVLEPRGHPAAESPLGPCFVAAPLLAGQQVVGIGVADNAPSGRRIPPSAVEGMTLLCQQLATALEQSQLHAQTRAREHQAVKLRKIVTQLASELDMDRVLDQIARETLDLLRCDAAGIHLYDERAGGLRMSRGINLDPALVAGLVLAPGEGVAGRAFAQRRPAWTQDRLADAELAYGPAADELVRALAPRAFLAVPIVSRSDVRGVLMGYFFAPHAFTPDEVRLLSTLADQAAIALANSALFEEVETQRRRLSEILDSTSDGMLLAGRDGCIEAANRRAGELLGVAVESLLGVPVLELVARHGAEGPGRDALAAAVVGPLDAPGPGADGDLQLERSKRVVHWTARPTRAADGPAAGLTLTLHDVTQEREVSQMKSDFVSFVSHQLRTPLAGIKWMLELAATPEQAAEETLSFVGDARAATDRLISLVNDLLDISRLERGRMTVTVTPTDLGGVTRSVLDELGGLVRERGHRVAVEGAEALRAVPTDGQLVRQVVLNLVSNAVKYTPPGGVLAIRMARDGDAAAWEIEDSGVGVPEGARPQLFEKFFRADNVRSLETEGTGLGLYLVRLIVEQLGGRVWCRSIEGRGATFGFALPCREER